MTSVLRRFVFLASTVAFAGPIASTDHPNYQSQINAPLLRLLEGDLEGLQRQFPQYLIVYQPPLIGYLSPVNPAQWIVWTTQPSASGDPFQLANLNGFAPPSPAAAAIPPDPIPEPAGLALAAVGLCALYGFQLARSGRDRRRPGLRQRDMQLG